MSAKPDSHTTSVEVPDRTIEQLDELVRNGRFATRQAAVAAAVERLYTEGAHSLNTRQKAFVRLCGTLRLGTTRQSLREAERDRLCWESGQL